LAEDNTPLRLVTEIEFVARCVLHGTDKISFQPRPMNLGHGRMVIDVGRAQCLACVSSVWLTIDLYETKWENVAAQLMRENMRRVLEEEMKEELKALANQEPELIEEESNQRPPAPAGSPGPSVSTASVRPALPQSATPAFGARRRLH
jgi:hypothetical protein